MVEKHEFCTDANLDLVFKDLKTTCLPVAPFMVQISPKYFHSLKPQSSITFNSSKIFEAHPSTSLLKFLLGP